MSRVREAADAVRKAGSAAEMQKISEGLTPAERDAVVAEMERKQ
jgi:hypothetical protein